VKRANASVRQLLLNRSLVTRVREEAERAFGRAVQYTLVAGWGTRVEVPATVDPEHFAARMHAAIAAARNRDDRGGRDSSNLRRTISG
jgi:hypothetical protein